MGVNLTATGNAIYQSIKDDAMAIAKIKGEAKTLALSIATNPEASNQITSATVNGQSFSTTSSMTQLQRLQLLRWVIKCADNCGTISKTQIPIF